MAINFLDNNCGLDFLAPSHVGLPFTCKDREWKSIQHFYQAQKAFDKGDRLRIQEASTPEDAHAIGQQVRRVANWSRNKAKYLAEGYWSKITQNEDYMQRLMKEKGSFVAIMEDSLLGVNAEGKGENVFGLLIGNIRDRLIEHSQQNRYFRIIAEQLAARINSNMAIKELAKNSAIIGAYAEATIREFVRTTVAPLRVSNGGVISFDLCGSGATIPQIDTLIWHPTPLPAIFEAGEFALIDVNSCLGILEIKRSMYSGVGVAMKKLLDASERLTCWVGDGGLNLNNSLGVICLQENEQSDKQVQAMVSEGQAVVILRENGDRVEADVDGIFRLVNFLGRMRRRASANDGTNSIVIPENDKRPLW